jgi:WD40 repeat protein
MTRGSDIPRQLGNYQLVHLLKQGKRAAVYLGKHIHMRSYVAVKMFHAYLRTDDQVYHFRQEAETIAQLTHPNIMRMLDFDVQDDVAFTVMDYTQFGSLWRQYVRGLVVIPLPAVISYVNQVARALYYAHQRGILHLNVKPGNMLVAKDFHILLSDFSIMLPSGSSQIQSTPDLVNMEEMGTLAYLAPEQIQRKPQPASDQYALAITVYEWLCAIKPFKGTLTELATKHLSTPPSPLSFHVPAINSDVEQVVLQALAKDPEQRFPSVQDFAKALEKASGVELRLPSEERFTTALWVGRNNSPQAFVPEDEDGEKPPSSKLALDGTVLQPTMHMNGDEPDQRQSPLLARRAFLLVAAGIVGAGVAGELALAVLSASSSLVVGQQHTSPIEAPTMLSKPTPPKVVTPIPISTPNPTPGALVSIFYGQADTVFSVAWSPDGTRLASGGVDWTAQVWRAADGSSITSDTGHTGSVNYVAWSPDGNRFASASDDMTVRVCSASTGRFLFAYTGHTDMVHSVVWSPDGKRLASGSYDNTVRIWDATNGTTLKTYTGHTASVWTVAWSPDGTKVASASGFAGVIPPDNTVKIWDVITGATLLTYTGHKDSVIYVVWSPDGKRIASGSADTTVHVWDAMTGKTRQTFRGHSGTVYGVAWSPDGKCIASGSVDTTVQLWDVATNSSYYTYRGHTYPVYGVAWSPDGTQIASGGDDTTVRIWQA